MPIRAHSVEHGLWMVCPTQDRYEEIDQHRNALFWLRVHRARLGNSGLQALDTAAASSDVGDLWKMAFSIVVVAGVVTVAVGRRKGALKEQHRRGH